MDTNNEEHTEQKDLFDMIHQRALEIKKNEIEYRQAFSIADFENKINREWPSSWGDDLHVLIYGDFEPPEADIDIPQLGITVHHEKQENTVIRNALCVLDATITIKEKNVDEVLDAIHRINTLLGTLTLIDWQHGNLGWWSHITHDSGGGVISTLKDEYLLTAIDSIMKLPPSVKKRVNSALYWIREPSTLVMEYPKYNIFRLYSGLWNAFECLVEAICELKPQEKLSKNDKEELINKFISDKGGRLSTSDCKNIYQDIINPGFVGKASHALRICFSEKVETYIEECFTQSDAKNRLYDIRNDINHGNIDAEDPNERFRVESRIHKLWMIVWGIFGRHVNFPSPVDIIHSRNDSSY